MKPKVILLLQLEKQETKPSCGDPGECAHATAMRSFKDNYTFYSIENYDCYCIADSASIFNNTNDNTYDFDDNINNGIAYDSKLDSNGIENSIHLNFISIIVLLIVIIFLQTHILF
ncbi:hypothetical protein H8356DRAFT_1391976 [Neocallimastix lanati (nom. inval.)]|uniref:Uncharacterized protein n=1 Tax=Neocallimastix californiae TaxID=1754190 RepID=A0A1Y2ALZ7_9FUNG|nr:hypothetical protein H8356DRAFT_1391976 [Neocallimastix sp. JGI-2020a]ORY23581.1 hypothetical protein LY90DRAFT_514969 [Neocallimastix californiae]|eukprot:ORY23581.1 hypothetical protein LY90DRAFT_514969 [Neocallimastix californiae]